jgi:hypothetical protein
MDCRGSLVRSPAAARLTRAPGAIALVAAVIPLAAYLWVASHRLGYPYELDWMEGGSVELAGRVLAGHSLYAAPSLRFVGWTYPPLYYLLSAGVAEVTGLGFLPLRLVSAGASVATMAALAIISARATGDRLSGLVSAGLYAASFAVSGAWFDVGRVDSLFLALTLVALAYGGAVRGAAGGVLLGLLGFLAVFTKQSALVALLPPLGYLVIWRFRPGVAALLTLLALVLASSAVLDVLSHGWYRYYVVDELAGQPWLPREWIGFWRQDLLAHEWPLAILALAALVGHLRADSGRPRARPSQIYLAAGVVGLLAAAWVSRLHAGGYLNVLMPAYAATALVGGLSFARLRRTGRLGATTGALVIAVQIALLPSALRTQIPSATDRLAGAELLTRLRELRGPVLVLRHPWYAAEVGKGNFAQGEAITDVLRSAAPRGARVLGASLRSALNRDHVQAVVLDGTFDSHLFGDMLSHDFRRAAGRLTRLALYPLTDVQSAPMLLYLRKPAEAPTPGHFPPSRRERLVKRSASTAASTGSSWRWAIKAGADTTTRLKTR